MFFTRRRWALRVTERMGLDPRSKEATTLVDLMIFGAKNLSQRSILGKPSSILMVAYSMAENTTAVGTLARDLSTDILEAQSLLTRQRQAAKGLANEGNFVKLIAAWCTAEPLAERLDGKVVPVTIMDPVYGVVDEFWKIGNDVSEASFPGWPAVLFSQSSSARFMHRSCIVLTDCLPIYSNAWRLILSETVAPA